MIDSKSQRPGLFQKSSSVVRLKKKNIAGFIPFALVVFICASLPLFAQNSPTRFQNQGRGPDYQHELAGKLISASTKIREAAGKETDSKISTALFRLAQACLEEGKAHQAFFDTEQPALKQNLRRQGEVKAAEVNRLREELKNLGYKNDILPFLEESDAAGAKGGKGNKLPYKEARAEELNKDYVFFKSEADGRKGEIAQVLYTLAQLCLEESRLFKGEGDDNQNAWTFRLGKIEAMDERRLMLKQKAESLGYRFPEEKEKKNR